MCDAKIRTTSTPENIFPNQTKRTKLKNFKFAEVVGGFELEGSSVQIYP